MPRKIAPTSGLVNVGVQEQFSAPKPPKTYRYDSRLDPALSWGENRDRELVEWLLGLVERCAAEGEKAVFAQAQEWKGGGVRVESLKTTADFLRKLTKPFLDWSGKAERHEIDIPTVPLRPRHFTASNFAALSVVPDGAANYGTKSCAQFPGSAGLVEIVPSFGMHWLGGSGALFSTCDTSRSNAFCACGWITTSSGNGVTYDSM